MLIYTKLHEKACCYLLINYMKNASQKFKTDEILVARDLCNLHSCYMKNALVFSKRDARNLFIHIITSDIQAVLCYRSCCKERGGVMASALVRDLTG